MQKYDIKIYRSGNTLEVIEYGKSILKYPDEDRIKPIGRKEEASEADKLTNRSRAMQKARGDLRRLIQANSHQWADSKGKIYKPVFMTLTFAENIQDLGTANHEFKLFIMRLGYLVGGRKNNNCLKYVVVPEFQKRGAIHYHLVLFNLPYIKASKISEIWRNGFIKLNAIDKVDNVGAYVCKYMGKDLEDERLRGKKSYFGSRGLLKTIEMEIDASTELGRKKLESVVQTAQALCSKPPYIAVYESEYYESISYSQYTLKTTSEVVV